MATENKIEPEVLLQVRQARDILNDILQLGEELAAKSGRAPPVAQKKVSHSRLDFSMPIRPFMKAYSNGMSGPQKFALLVAYLAKSDEQKTIALADIEKEWDRMTELLGGKFNRAYSGRARNDDLVAAEKAGFYRLRPNWQAIFK